MNELDLKHFLFSVITTENGYFCIANRSSTGIWSEEFRRWPDDIEYITERAAALSPEYDVYYSPHLFSEPKSEKQYVLSTRTVAADLDEANILTLPIKPTLLVETSPERHHAYWVLRSDADDIEALSRRMTYSIPRCDRTGWYLGKKLRLPGTLNHKYRTSATVHVIEFNGRKFEPVDLELLPALATNGRVAELGDSDEIAWADDLDIGPQELLATVRPKIPGKVHAQYNIVVADRSAALWALMTAAFRAGLDRQHVYWLAKHSANNKFADLRMGGKRELAKDVLRAEEEALKKAPDLRLKIQDARKLQGTNSEKNAFIAHLIMSNLTVLGQFIHCDDESLWYIRDDIGRPIRIIERSGGLQNMLDTMFGINATEPESRYVINNLISNISDTPTYGILGVLSHYDPDGQQLLLHTGRKDVLKITADKTETVVNGYNGVVFPWLIGSEPVVPNYSSRTDQWDEELFGDCLDNVIGVSRETAKALLKVWFLSILFRNSIVSRPILALLGQPGAGKSTLFRRVYALLYGRSKSLNAVTSSDDFDFAVATDPLVVLDNVDSWQPWLPDKMALAAASSEVMKRKLYTNLDTVTMKRQAMLGVTAHNPKFGREDVTDRLLILNFERLQVFKPETEIINRILARRSFYWGQIVREVQSILASTLSPDVRIPQFRVEDFARHGMWIANALGTGDTFRQAVNEMSSTQKAFALDQDTLLLDAISSYLKKGKEPDFRTPGQWWGLLENAARDPRAFQKQYINSLQLGRKLWALNDALKIVFDIQWRFDPVKGSRTWRIECKDETDQ